MLVLGINTCLATADLALVQNGKVVATRLDAAPRGHEARLPALLNDLMAEAELTLGDLDRIAVVTGPGSFTGIRIGVSFARGLALALKADIVGLTALEAGIDREDKSAVRAAMPAKKRPPDRTWWVQSLKDGLGVDDVVEVSAEQLGDTVEATPNATWAALKAVHATPHAHPPRPTYARAPDAKPMDARKL
ncbi:MAG: tRNA (adenosine(37)-N6)-threonylcarbamoyltransferase complex dimerization subunit type 1 TsaB [Pseudomonadota bacterium]